MELEKTDSHNVHYSMQNAVLKRIMSQSSSQFAFNAHDSAGFSPLGRKARMLKSRLKQAKPR